MSNYNKLCKECNLNENCLLQNTNCVEDCEIVIKEIKLEIIL